MKKIKILLIVVLVIFLTGCDILMDDTMEDIDVYTTTYPTNYLIKYLYKIYNSTQYFINYNSILFLIFLSFKNYYHYYYHRLNHH